MAGTLGHWDQKLISCVQWPLHPLQLLAAPRLRCFCFLKNNLTGEWEPGPAIGGSGGRTGDTGTWLMEAISTGKMVATKTGGPLEM